jgi:2-oxoisovalerate dehydrogenase E1 component
MKEHAEDAIKAKSFEDFRNEVINDYRIANESRHASLIGRKEVLTGKAKFGIFGDGKEVAQVAMAKQFLAGDFRAGYYRDQTFMFATGESNLLEFFAQLYANPDVEQEPSSAGRSMNGHYATRSLNPDGSWKNLTQIKNSSSDISPTAAQMPRLVGLAWASKLYRNNTGLHHMTAFSNKGNEVAFGTIGDASTSEGIFFEAINAAGVLQIPMAISVWDDGYGISVPAKYQTTKENVSEILRGFERNDKGEGYLILRARGWDYPALCEMYAKGINVCRNEHVPVLFHIREMTQPQGHSTSGSHERYKTKERLKWEEDFDCIQKMRSWMIESAIATAEECDAIEDNAKKYALECRKKAWDNFMNPIRSEIERVNEIFSEIISENYHREEIKSISEILTNTLDPSRRDIDVAIQKALVELRFESFDTKEKLSEFYKTFSKRSSDLFNSHLYSISDESVVNIKGIPAEYDNDSPMVDGREVLQANFKKLFENDPRLVAFGEDLGHIGDVNQGFAGLQSIFGELRITDCGIREATIAGQGIGLALRGLRPIAEIQYLDYLLYALQILSDDLASLHYRTRGGQKAPVIIRTRGHRLEGIWHSGSPLGMIINSLRGINVLVPRNMVQAAGFYNTMLASDEPALIIECLNGYRIKEKLPTNIGEFRISLGQPEIIREGTDLTLVTYGSCVRIAGEAADRLEKLDISTEIIDVQTLLPFDLNQSIVESLKKTGKLLILDEDVPGGASAFILQQVIETQNGFRWLDSPPKTLTAKSHRPAYGSDGDFYSKPSTEDVINSVYNLMNEFNPSKFPLYI